MSMTHSTPSNGLALSRSQRAVAARPDMTTDEREIQARSVLDSLRKHIALLDSAGNIVSVNRDWREFGVANGATPEQADSAGVNYFDVCESAGQTPKDDYAAAARDGIKAVLAGAQPTFELEYPCHSPTEPRWFLMRVSPLVGPHGGAVVTHETITERWRLERQRAGLIAELLNFKAALDAHALVAITDARGRISYVNDKFCAVSKWSRDELLGQDHRIINSGYHPKEFIKDLWDTIRSGRIWKGELKNVAKDGSHYWVDTTIIPFLDADGRPFQYIAIRAEITGHKLLQEHNAEILEELRAANQELSDFAYVVSHDLKAPLRGISSLASWLVSDFSEKLGSEGREHLDLISTRVKRLSGMIDAILAYSRAGRGREERTSVALGALLRNTIDLLAPPAHIHIEVTGELPQLNVVAVKFQQVFQNLLSNAIDFMDKPAGRIAVGCVRDGLSWHFSVADNGPGIEERHFERIFTLFQTLASRDTMERTGVGLALVKKLVELEGGKIWVESTVGAGTTFHFTIPAQTLAGRA